MISAFLMLASVVAASVVGCSSPADKLEDVRRTAQNSTQR